MSHSLVEIPREHWIKLRDLYNERRKEASGYGLLQTIIQWIEKDSTLDINIFSLDGDWESDGTFVFIHKGLGHPHISFNTLSDSLERVTTALNCLDINLSYLFFAFPERLETVVKDHFKYAGIDVALYKPDVTAWYHIDKEKALQFEVDAPDGYKFLSLGEQHAELVNSVWPHRAPGSIEFVKRLINLNDSVGLFDKSDNLVAWCLRLPIGSLGLLQVMDSHKRKGFGNLVVRYMAKAIATKNEEVMAPVVTANTASRAMFEKLGFTVIDHVYWVLKN